MREILFRGKRLDNGEWVEGSLWLNGARARIRADLGFPAGASWCEVDPTSVGQFIGVLDKRGEGFSREMSCKTRGFAFWEK